MPVRSLRRFRSRKTFCSTRPIYRESSSRQWLRVPPSDRQRAASTRPRQARRRRSVLHRRWAESRRRATHARLKIRAPNRAADSLPWRRVAIVRGTAAESLRAASRARDKFTTVLFGAPPCPRAASSKRSGTGSFSTAENAPCIVSRSARWRATRLRISRIFLHSRLDTCASRRIELAVCVGHQCFFGNRHAPSPSGSRSMPWSASRPRESRLVSVPTGTSSTSAASL